ncbi:hypothetical protein Glove_114g168 [Diversispora epigaea]|uniref:Protein kinase domain-containing protein n=1 Tax=Diversispora epigaea TaxID=1348612 RepID=A0A397J5T2_9GLOM|nr:hypothetical protein Glove_114g168 [Diversispora epigaea]
MDNEKNEKIINASNVGESDVMVTENIVADIIQPFIPLFNIVNRIVEDLFVIYENVIFNRRICAAILDRFEVLQQGVSSLRRKKDENEKKFSDQKYYISWIRLTDVMEDIKIFAKEVTQQSVFQKYSNVQAIKETYDKHIQEFEAACKDLNFLNAIFSEEQREQENKLISEDVNILRYVMNELNDDIKNIVIHIKTIDYSEILDPDNGPDNIRGSNKTVVKKIYRGRNVACKQVQNIDNLKIQAERSILNLFRVCSNVIYFYGLSYTKDHIRLMIFEWASYGNLKEFYTKFDISWTTKLRFIRDIFHGLYFVYSCGILHHDVRYENILITENHDAKISNFGMTRKFNGEKLCQIHT